ncbi:MAG: outer membrane protein assembly factor BamB family protein [Planctomycetota bacterium]|jgi:outer membrane protein assembly factor BamB
MNKLVALRIGIGFLIALVSVDAYGDSRGDYWPAWRGPDATGVAVNGNPPVTWSETENIKWKVKLPGQGTSSPIIWADRIFFQTAMKTGKKGTSAAQAGSEDRGPDRRGNRRRPFHGGRTPTNVYKFDLVCLDRKSGKILWQKTAREELPHEGHHPNHDGFACYSPVTDGKHVWVSFGSRGVHCYDMNGNHKWSRDMGKMRKKMVFGEGSSPALAGGAVIVVMDHEGDSFIYALNKKTGETVWKKPRDEATTWATPIVVEVNGKMQVVINATKRIRSYDLETGNLIWQCGGQTGNVIPSPVSGFGKVFCTSGFRGNALQAIELGRTGDLTGSNAVSWQVDEATPYVPSPLLYGDKIYVCSGNRAIVSCYQAKTGKANFVKQQLEGMREIFASPVAVANRVYFVGRDGVSKVIKRAEEFQVLATNTLDDRFDASPAIVGDELFLKGKTYLYCIAEPREKR